VATAAITPVSTTKNMLQPKRKGSSGVPEGAVQEGVGAAGARDRGAQLRVAERARQGEESADQPDEQAEAGRADLRATMLGSGRCRSR
jgi:hypothetical protein